MTIILTAGQTKKLDVSLTLVILPTDIRIFFIDIYPPSCYVNDTVEIWISVKNYSAITGTKTVTCLVNGTPIGSKTVTVEEASAVYAKFSFTPTQAGTYTISTEVPTDKWAILTVLNKPVTPEVPQILIDYHSQYVRDLPIAEQEGPDKENWANRRIVYGAHSNYEITEASLAQSGRNMVISLKGNYILSSDLPYGDYPPTIYCVIKLYEKGFFEQGGQEIGGINTFEFGGVGKWIPSKPEGVGISGIIEFNPAGQFEYYTWSIPYGYREQAYINVCNLGQAVPPPGTYVITVLVGIEITERGGQWLIPEYYYQWAEITIPALELPYIPYSEYVGHLGDSEYWNYMWATYCGR